MELNKDVSDFLEHYGVLGMKWGVTRSPAQLARARKDSYKKNRALNKSSKAKEKAKRDAEFEKVRTNLRPNNTTSKHDTSTKEGRLAAKREREADIDRARARIDSGAARADFKEAKSQYKQDKVEMGSREARKILNTKRNELYTDAARAQEVRDGREATLLIINTLTESLKEYNQQKSSR